MNNALVAFLALIASLCAGLAVNAGGHGHWQFAGLMTSLTVWFCFGAWMISR